MSVTEGDVRPGARATEAPAKGIICVVDLGEHSRRRVRRLRRGEGRLMERVEDAVAALQENGVLESGAQTVVVVVRQERAGLFSDKDDDDDDDDDLTTTTIDAAAMPGAVGRAGAAPRSRTA